MCKWLQRYVFSLENVWKRRKMIENKKKCRKNLVVSEKSSTFATAFEKYLNCFTDAPLAQLVEQLTLNQWV